MKKFDIPTFYRSPIISKIKEIRRVNDKMKNVFTPTSLDFGDVQFFTARHFGFCYGVENAIEIIYDTINNNPDKRIFLLSEMIHNSKVNADLLDLGVKFIMDTLGNQLIEWSEVKADDIVVIPAFGTSVEIEDKLKSKGIQIEKYDTTCPFVSKVWKRTQKLGKEEYTVVVHGKPKHEETRATFSHSKENAPTIVIKDIKEAEILGDFILGKIDMKEFPNVFKDRYSENFDPSKHLSRIGVVNQTTMLANETQEIADYLKGIMQSRFDADIVKDHFADTRDTLCYATNDNQRATYAMLEQEADLAIVVGGYNSSNTSHLVELCEEKLPTYFISSEDNIISKEQISHFNFRTKKVLETENWLPNKKNVKILVTSGASCPDATVDNVLRKVLSYFDNVRDIDLVLEEIEELYA